MTSTLLQLASVDISSQLCPGEQELKLVVVSSSLVVARSRSNFFVSSSSQTHQVDPAECTRPGDDAVVVRFAWPVKDAGVEGHFSQDWVDELLDGLWVSSDGDEERSSDAYG